ncbi:hypothetical protein ColLi_00515 [Colletotrichum liriopes]|uniref:TNFR-Cys domain-containing protein n=1 Tax=Colletotrichum liriopes TaxID=708192 RepID=A0AA37GBL1_9PEZI|nr:hypothetical protein ColLi_00515 [Colletotrichum liriopes]
MKFAVVVSAVTLLVSGASAAWCRDCNYYTIVNDRCSGCSASEIHGTNQRCVNCGSSCPAASDYSGYSVHEC